MTCFSPAPRSIYRNCALIAPLFALLLLFSNPVCGQAIVGLIPVLQASPANSSASLVLDTAKTVVPIPAEPVPSGRTAAEPDRLRHLPATNLGWRINGEMGALQWPVFLADAEVAATRRFQLAYRSSASVLPDVSVIVLTINDVVVGRYRIASPANVKPIEIEVPPDLLRHGFNAVKVSVEQRHRVDCSLDATYELWTQILPTSSGFLTSGGAHESRMELSDLPGLRPRADGALPIEVMLEGKLKPKRVDLVTLAAQAVAMAGRFQMPVVYFTPDQKVDAGVRLLVGTQAEIASLVELPVASAPIAGPATFLLPSQVNGGVPTLVLTGVTEEDVALAISQLAASAKVELTGTTPGIRTAKNLGGLPVSGGETIRMSDLGISSSEFSGRFFRLGIDIAMPADFLVADYAKFAIDLAGGYAAGLNSDAQVRVEVNGRNGANVALPNPSGDVFRHNEIFVPLSLLRPGPNRIEILAQLPNKSDRECEAADSAESETKRFLLLSNTEIRFPPIARVGLAPDLLQTAAGGLPYAGSAARPTLHVPTPNRETLSAAVTFAVRMAVAAHDPIPFTLTLTPPGDLAGPALIVAPAQALDPKLMEAIGLDPDAVRDVWEQRAAPGNALAALPAARVVLRDNQTEELAAVPRQSDAGASSTVVALRSPSGGTPGNSESEELVDQWADMIRKRSVWDEPATAIRSLVRRVTGLTTSLISAAHRGIGGMPAANPIDSRASLIVAQGFRAGQEAQTITIVTAPESGILMHATELLMEPARWSSLRGRLAVVDDAANLVSSVEATRVSYRETQPRSFANTRLIAAGWFSLNPVAYVMSALLLAGLLASATLSLIRSVGRRSK